MSDPTNPADPKPTEEAVTAADAGADTAELAAVPASAENSAGAETPGEAHQPAGGDKPAGAEQPVGDDKPAGAEQPVGGDKPAGGEQPVGREKAAGREKAVGGAAGNTKVDVAGGEPKKKKWWRRVKVRGPWLTVGAALVILIALALLGYIWGLGPLNRLNTERGITPPAKLAGLDRITDKTIRDQAGLDQTREALSRINNGKQVTVEAYGSLDGDRLFVIIALRGKVDIDKTVADSGATPDKIKKIGSSTCVESSGNLPTQCYRGSNTLTVIAQSANEGVNVDKVEPVAEEAFKAMR